MALCRREIWEEGEQNGGDYSHLEKKKLIPDDEAADNYVSELGDKYFFQDLLMDHSCA